MSGPQRDRGYRYVRFDEPRAPWRATIGEAALDALDDEQAIEAWWPPHTITVSWPGAIQRTRAPVETEPRPLTRHRRRLEEPA